MTRLGGIGRLVQSRSRRGYLAWNCSTSARRSAVSGKNSALPSTVTPRSSPPPDPASATTHTRASRRRLRILWVPSTLIMVRLVASCRNHIGIASGAPSACTVARIATSLVARKRWMRASPSVIDVAPFRRRVLSCHAVSPMRFGWLTLRHSPSGDGDHAAIHEQVAQACFAETAGFDGIWLTEHNFTGESVYCDPIPFASVVAARTSRIRIGFAVIQLALRHPIRIATELALLDNLSGGRLDIGVGHGTNFNEYEFVGFGLRSHDSRERMAETLEVMVRAWTEAPLVHQGKFYQLSLPELRPRPLQRPHPPIWRAVSSAGSVRDCGRLGAPILLPRLPIARVPERLALYDAGLAESGLDPAIRRQRREQAAVWRWVYVADSQRQAEDELTAALLETRRHMLHDRASYNPPDFTVEASRVNPWNDPRLSHEDGVRYYLEHSALYGPPDRVAEQVAAVRDTGAHHVESHMSL